MTAMDVASYTFSRRRRIASSCNARMSFTFGSEASRRACGRGRVTRRRRGGARSVKARRREAPAFDGKTNAAARWRGVGCCTSTEAETCPGRIEGLAFAAVRAEAAANRWRRSGWRAPEDLSFRSSSLCPYEVDIFMPSEFPSGSAAAHTSLRVRASTRRRGRCSRRRRRQPRRARPRGRHRCPGSAGRDARLPTPTRPRGPSAARPSVARFALGSSRARGRGRGRGSPRAEPADGRTPAAWSPRPRTRRAVPCGREADVV